MSDEIETLRARIAELDIDVAVWTNTAKILHGRAEKAEARIAELERSNDKLRQIERNVQAAREHEFQRAEKAEAALTDADRMAEAIEGYMHSMFRVNELEAAVKAYRKETGQ